MNKKKVPLFNPLSHTFTYDWKDDKNEVHTLIMEPISIEYFEPSQVDFIVRHLADEVMNKKKYNGINHAHKRKEIEEQIRVKV